MKLTAIIATATTAAVLGTAGVSIAGAATTSGSTKPDSSASATAPKAGHPRARRAIARHAFLLSAKTIGVSPAELLKDLQSGQTIAQVATAHNVQPQTVIDALVKAADARIEKAKANGKISADRAAKLEAKVPTLAANFVNNPHPHAGQNRNK